jgi:thiosulfate reductase cytochrome b subunit
MSSVALDEVAVSETAAAVVPKHHALVRLSHWLNVPILAGLVVTGLAIYWASPVYLHPPDRKTGSSDYLSDFGIWLFRHLPGPTPAGQPRFWFYDHFSIGTFSLAPALRLHWLFAYAFMICGALYALGLILGGGYRALLPRRTDPVEALAMIRYYVGVGPMKVLRRPWPHPPIKSKYNALQRSAYASMPLVGLLAVASGWAMHKPVQLGWLERLFVSYNGARVVHFWTMWVLVSFVVPHVVLVIADGWDAFRSMIVGWSARTKGAP